MYFLEEVALPSAFTDPILPVLNQPFVSPASPSPWLLGLPLLINTPEQILAWDPLLTCRGQVLLSALAAKAGLDNTSHHKYFIHFYSCSFSMGHYSLLPALQIPLIPTWAGWLLRVNHLPLVDPTVRYLVWDFSCHPVVVNPCNSCKGGVLGFGVSFCY